jgi:hypothetical protein
MTDVKSSPKATLMRYALALSTIALSTEGNP